MVTSTTPEAPTARAGDGDRLAKLARLACDPDAPEGERDGARRAFLRLATRAGLLDRDAPLPVAPCERNGHTVHLTPEQEQAQFHAIWPATAHPATAHPAPAPPIRSRNGGIRPQRRRSKPLAPVHAPSPHRCPLFDHAMDRWVTAAIVGAGGVAGALACLIQAQVLG